MRQRSCQGNLGSPCCPPGRCVPRQTALKETWKLWQRPSRQGGGSRRCIAPAAAYQPSRTARGTGSLAPEGTAIEHGTCRIVEGASKAEGRSVVASMAVYATVDQVCKVLTDFKRLPNVVPNLVESRLLPSPSSGVMRLRQTARVQAAFWRLEASAVMDVSVCPLPLGAKELRFAMVDGDFTRLSGRWLIEPDESVKTGLMTRITYEINVETQGNFRLALVQLLARSILANNLFALGRHIEQVSQSEAAAPGFLAKAMGDQGGFLAAERRAAPQKAEGKGMAQPLRDRNREQAGRRLYLGMQSIPLPQALRRPPANPKVPLNSSGATLSPWQATEAVTNLQGDEVDLAAQVDLGPALLNEGGLLPPEAAVLGALEEAMTEVHCRRMDTAEEVHRRVIAAVLIDSPPELVWQVLTDYEALPKIIPGLESCTRVPQPGAPKGLVRLRQVGQKLMPYLTLRAQAELDVVEKPLQEIQFRQASGSFSLLQGKWILQNPGGSSPRTILKYAVEVALPRDGMMGSGKAWWEPLMERLIFEDLVTNLCSIKSHVQQLDAQRNTEMLDKAYLRFRAERPRRQDMAKSFNMLQAELIRCFGDDGSTKMPTRADLRAAGRADLERALEAHGGLAEVAKRMGWKTKHNRKPKGYWHSFDNVAAAIFEYNEEDPSREGVMPSVAELKENGMYGLAKAVEQFGGMAQVAEELGLKVKSKRGGRGPWHDHLSEVAKLTGLSRADGLFDLASRTYKLPRKEALRIINEVAGAPAKISEQPASSIDSTEIGRGTGHASTMQDPQKIHLTGERMKWGRFGRSEIDQW